MASTSISGMELTHRNNNALSNLTMKFHIEKTKESTTANLTFVVDASTEPEEWHISFFESLLFSLTSQIKVYESVTSKQSCYVLGSEFNPKVLFDTVLKTKKTTITVNYNTVDLFKVIPDLLIGDYKGARHSMNEIKIGYVRTSTADSSSLGRSWEAAALPASKKV